MTETTHGPAVGVRAAAGGGWEAECLCGQKFFEDSRSKVRRASRAHYNLADQDVALPFSANAFTDLGEPEPEPTTKTVASMVFTDEGNVIITTFDADGEPVTLDNSHPNFARILKAIQGNGEIGNLLSTTPMFENLDAVVEVRDDGVYYGDWQVHNSLTETIKRYQQEGRPTDGLVKFMERLMANPSENSREQLFTWAQAKDLTIDEDGYIVAFKAVTRDMTSRNTGRAYVDGVEHNGAIPYPLGAIVHMPREEVADAPGVRCSTGLHVGTLRYARTFGPPVIIQVKIDPADCVSVPRDSNFEKMRVCKLEVLSTHPREEVKESDLWEHEPAPEQFEDVFEQLAEADQVPESWLRKVRNRFTTSRRRQEANSDDATS